MSSGEESVLQKRYSFAEEERVTISVMDVEYRLEKVSHEVMRVVRKTGENETEKYVGLNTGNAVVTLQPVFYDLPTMVKLNQELIIGPRRDMRILVDIPIKLQLRAEMEGNSINLDELRDEHLLQSHYGPTYKGIFCNAIYSPVHTGPDSITKRDYSAAMPLTVESNYARPVSVTRVLVYMDRLMLFLMGDNLLSNRVVMKIKSAHEADIAYHKETVAPGLTKVLENRSPLETGAMGKLFGLGTTTGGDLEFGF